MEWIASPEAWIALGTLTVLEIVLGIDNIVFITILSGKLPPEKQPFARQLGLGLAMLTRILLLFSLVWIMRLTVPLFSVFGHAVSGRDLILVAGGMFLLMKATTEIHHRLEGDEGKTEDAGKARWGSTFAGVITQIVLLDIVFSLDSVITAVGVAEHVAVMVIAIVIAVGVMMISAESVGAFVLRHPTVKMLALSFLLLIGMSLVRRRPRPPCAEGIHLLRHGFFAARGDAESEGEEDEEEAGRATCPLPLGLCGPRIRRKLAAFRPPPEYQKPPDRRWFGRPGGSPPHHTSIQLVLTLSNRAGEPLAHPSHLQIPVERHAPEVAKCALPDASLRPPPLTPLFPDA